MTRPAELHHDAAALHAYNEKVWSRHARLDTTVLACVVTADYLFELYIFLASVRRAWTFYPWKVVAFSPERETVEAIRRLAVPNLEPRLLEIRREETDWAANAALKVALIEHGGLERGLVSDLDNLFVAETPELWRYLDTYDLVFIGAPHAEWVIQTSLWGYRRTTATIEFSRRWMAESAGRPHSDASGLPFALRDLGSEGPPLLVVAQRPKEGAAHLACPYDVQANIRPFELTRDLLGYSERYMGRAKVVHFGGIRRNARESVAQRMEYLARHFPESFQIFPYYIECANEAAEILGMGRLRDPEAFLADLIAQEAGLAAHVDGVTRRLAESEATIRGLRASLAATTDRAGALERQAHSLPWLFAAVGREVAGLPGAALRGLRRRSGRR